MANLKHIKPDELPEEWSVHFFEELVTYNLGRTPSRNENIFWDKGIYPWVSITDMSPYGTIYKTKEKVSEEAHKTVFRGKLVPKGTLLMSFKLTIGRMARLGIPAYHNEAIISIFPLDKNLIDEDYLFYFLSQIDYSQYQDTAVKGMTLNKGKIDKLEIASPPFFEQRRIANILNTVQTAIEQQARLIALTRELKSALMHKLFTEGLHDEKQKETEIGMMPESWESIPLDNLLTKTQYGLSIRGGDNGKYSILRMTNQVDGKISTDKMQFVNIKEKELECYRLSRGDILFNRTNSLELVGRTAIFDVEGDYVFASYLIRLRTDENVMNPFFLNHYLNWDQTQKRLKSIALRAVSQSNISATRLRTFQVPVPTLKEQADIIGSIDTVVSKINLHQKKKLFLEVLFRTLLHQLMTGQFRVDEVNLPDIP